VTYDARKLLYETGGGFPQSMVTGYDETTQSFNTLHIDQQGNLHSNNYVWETSLMAWVPAETTNGVSIVGVTDSTDTRINPSTEDSLQKLLGFSIPPYDYVSLSYTGIDLTGVVYKTGGSGGTTVATLTLGYSGGELVSVARS